VIQRASSTIVVADQDLRSMVDLMRVAAERRIEGVLGNSRRRHYGHAAMLVASGVVLAAATGGRGFLRGCGATTDLLASSRVQRRA
jgi:hypothetical protein